MKRISLLIHVNTRDLVFGESGNNAYKYIKYIKTNVQGERRQRGRTVKRYVNSIGGFYYISATRERYFYLFL